MSENSIFKSVHVVTTSLLLTAGVLTATWGCAKTDQTSLNPSVVTTEAKSDPLPETKAEATAGDIADENKTTDL